MLTPKDYARNIPSPFPPKTDHYSKHNAAKLAALVTAAWVKRGVGNVVAEIFPISGMATAHWGVRSNLVGGLPPARVEKRGRHPNGKVKLTPPHPEFVASVIAAVKQASHTGALGRPAR